MITHIHSSVFDVQAQIIAHQVNCMGVMGSGVASQVKRHYPEAYKMYTDYCRENEHYRIGMLGNTQICPVAFNPDGSPRIYVANMFGQYDYGWSKFKVYTDYVALRQCLSKLSEFATENHLSIAIPFKIGCDRGNGNWDLNVYPMIESILRDNTVLLCEYSGR